jgi:hypothetical protein
MVMNDDSIFIKWKLLRWGKTIDVLRPALKQVEKVVAKRPTKRKRQRRSVPWKRIRAVLRSFQVRRFEFDVDTGDMSLNGVLYPVAFGLAWWSGRKWSVNFVERNVLVIVIRNTLARMIWAFVMKR